MLDLGSPTFAETLADALAASDRREDDSSRNLAESLIAGAIAGELRRPRANPVQLRMFGDHPNAVRPEKRPWPKTLAPAKPVPRPGKSKPYYGRKVTENKKPTEHEMTYVEIGEALGLSYERVRQIEKEALAKCRAACERFGIRVEDLFR